MPSDPDRTIKLRLTGPMVDDGQVPLEVLSVKLDALQKSFYNVAAGTSGMLPARGRWPDAIRQQCALLLVEVNKGSLELVAEVPSEPQLSMPHGRRLGVEGVQNFIKVVTAVADQNTQTVRDMIPDYGARLRAIKSIETLCPEPDADYAIDLSGMNGAPPARLRVETRRYLRESTWQEAAGEEYNVQSITGWLVMIRVSSQNHIQVVSNNREIMCYYPSELEGVISQLVAGSLVEVSGIARLDSRGAINKISEIRSVDTVVLLPFWIKEFVWDNRRFVLKPAVSCRPDFRNGLWVYECDLFGLHAYAETRERALRDFHEEFAAIWDGIAEEEDAALAPDAIELKNLLRNQVERIE